LSATGTEERECGSAFAAVNMNSSRLSIRPFTPRDIDGVLVVEAASFQGDTYSRELFDDLYRGCGPLFLVAQRQGAIAGYAVSCLRKNAASRGAEIVSLAVLPQERRRGVARGLLMRTLRLLRQSKVYYAVLTVRSDNTAAQSLYRAFGFQRIRRIPHYYEDGAEGIRMRKILTPLPCPGGPAAAKRNSK
jgi:[ribosomal protein S18]-alanine N-acetyltransferase